MKYKDLITAKIIADSVSPSGSRITTMEIEYPRFILAELNTHRMLSKNSASSRAIPAKALREHIKLNSAGPVYWGRNQAGMQAKESLSGPDLTEATYVWEKARSDALGWSEILSEKLNLHKQIANRITEPWMTMKTVISGTEWANFYYLRDHSDAQPEIRELAHKMYVAHSASTPQLLYPGEWHVPYINTNRNPGGVVAYSDSQGRELSAEDACAVSASCCAQVSYRKNDDTLEKAKKIYDQLIYSKPAHASPVEHQATPMDLATTCAYEPETWQLGVTHVSANGDLWSGNFRSWIQYRKLIRDEAVWGQLEST
jgi:hypothetical protein